MIAIDIEQEDHTLGNALRMELLNDPRVTFAGYRKHHPLEDRIELRVGGIQEYSGTGEIIRLIQHSCESIISKIDVLLNQIN